jgi:uncharacterized membrane protein YfcA
MIFTALGVVGSLIGNRVGRKIPQLLLKRIFAVFLLLMGGLILYQNAGRLI